MYKCLSGIYIITNIVNNKHYIGKSICLQSRLNNHKNCLTSGTHNNEYLQHSFIKYGKENFTFEILEFYAPDLLDHMENYWCNMLNTHNRSYGYNIEPIRVSGGNIRFAPQSIIKATKNRIGKKASKETRRKQSEIHKGKPIHTEESREKIRNSNRTRIISIDTIEKMSKSAKERTNRLGSCLITYNKSKSIKKVEQYDLEGNFLKLWNSVTEAAKEVNCTIAAISNVCNGCTKRCKKFVWKYQKLN